uniref:Matrin-type domain-containing protein n=1 Tax=Strigamia maritima TaxID=126957 RepID=T1JIP4_STRMM
MPKYYCDYCNTYLTHDSPSVRKTHCSGGKHLDNSLHKKWNVITPTPCHMAMWTSTINATHGISPPLPVIVSVEWMSTTTYESYGYV